MSYKISPSYFAIKYWDQKLDKPIRLHSISYNRCNFQCGFCNFSNRHSDEYLDYCEDEFEAVVKILLSNSSYFKFTGGEPTLNKNLIRDLIIVKSQGGHSFLDSNGSNPQVIEEICRMGLIDVLGLSFKGITAMAAQQTSCASQKLCWDNVFLSLKTASYFGTKTIVTMVFHDRIPLSSIDLFASLLGKR